MPLTEGFSKKSISENIGREIAAGKKPNQAAAIAYSVAGEARKKVGDDQEETYLSVLQEALTMEYEAIAIGLKLVSLCPPEDVSTLAEIANDEVDHAKIYTAILNRYQADPEEGE